ncbi:hypothetical protein BLI708_06620 [Bifidobacterium imperatoris]|uniref:Uncharacterized protein n=1 Tax=Bifidobacterium imperatoris TaxID=2020965 RepID=A0A2N5IQX1_9BIFI|nr:hypothetical protein [Bifidobacterium imperatoris]PLS24352.1 hypothetical protein Tam1G_1615 [Bifidobacterium imperatoris]QSY56946.1 hypothetical protein BLI708_06620 [Bifidobacterium imperatoris]
MSRETFEQTLKDCAVRSLPKLHDFIAARKTTESFLVTAEQIARWSGLVRRTGRIDDNQLWEMMRRADCPPSKVRKYGMRCWDAREAFEALAKYAGAYGWLVD